MVCSAAAAIECLDQMLHANLQASVQQSAWPRGMKLFAGASTVLGNLFLMSSCTLRDENDSRIGRA